MKGRACPNCRAFSPARSVERRVNRRAWPYRALDQTDSRNTAVPRHISFGTRFRVVVFVDSSTPLLPWWADIACELTEHEGVQRDPVDRVRTTAVNTGSE